MTIVDMTSRILGPVHFGIAAFANGFRSDSGMAADPEARVKTGRGWGPR